MSGLSGMRRQRLIRRIAAAAVVAAIAGVGPQLIAAPPATTKSAVATSAPSAKPTTTPSLKAGPKVHWFAQWDEQASSASTDLFATPAKMPSLALMQMQSEGPAAAGKPVVKSDKPFTMSDVSTLFPSGSKAAGMGYSDFAVGSKATVLTNVANLVDDIRKNTLNKNGAPAEGYDLTPKSANGVTAIGVAATHNAFSLSKSDDNAKLTFAAKSRGSSAFDWEGSGLRTGAFAGPIQRMSAPQVIPRVSTNSFSLATTGSQDTKKWAGKFTGFSTASLSGGSVSGYKFSAITSPTSTGFGGSILMSRADLTGQALKVRMRGAYSVALFSDSPAGNAIGYAKAMKQDVRDSWYQPSWLDRTPTEVAAAAPEKKTVAMTLNPTIDPASSASLNRSDGTLWSTEYGMTLASTSADLDKAAAEDAGDGEASAANRTAGSDLYDVFCIRNPLPESDAADDAETIAAATKDRAALIKAGMRNLLTDELQTANIYGNSTYAGSFQTKQVWLLNQNYLVFMKSVQTASGVPEWTSAGTFAAMATLALVCRRSRRKVPVLVTPTHSPALLGIAIRPRLLPRQTLAS